MHSGRAALYGYLLATDANLAALTQNGRRPGFGEKTSRVSLLNPGGNDLSSRFRLLDTQNPPDLSAILRIHSWCAAFVDWCVMQLLTQLTARDIASSRQPAKNTFGVWAFVLGRKQAQQMYQSFMATTRRRFGATSQSSTFRTPVSWSRPARNTSIPLKATQRQAQVATRATS